MAPRTGRHSPPEESVDVHRRFPLRPVRARGFTPEPRPRTRQHQAAATGRPGTPARSGPAQAGRRANNFHGLQLKGKRGELWLPEVVRWRPGQQDDERRAPEAVPGQAAGLAHQFLEDTGNDLVALAQILGHESLTTTATYTQRTQQQLGEASEKLNY